MGSVTEEREEGKGPWGGQRTPLMSEWIVLGRGMAPASPHPPPHQRAGGCVGDEQKEDAGAQLGLGSYPQEGPSAWPEASPAEATTGGIQREQRQSSLAPELETQPPSPTQDPIQPGVPRPINSLHLSRCPSCHSNHLLPDVSLATGQEWCTFLLLPPGSTLSSVSS